MATSFVASAVTTAVTSAVTNAMTQPGGGASSMPFNRIQGFGSEDLQREEDEASGYMGAGIRAATSIGSYGYGIF